MSSIGEDLKALKNKMESDPLRYPSEDMAVVGRAIDAILDLKEQVARGKKSKAGSGTQDVTGPLSDTEDLIWTILKETPELSFDIYELRDKVNHRGLSRNYQQIQRETSKLLGRGLITTTPQGVKLLYKAA